MLRPVIACLLAGVVPCAANAAILQANPTNLTTVFAAAQNGDTIVATGSFGSMALQNRTFTTRVTLDATNAIFNDTLTIKNVVGLNVLRGTFGSRTEPMRSARAVAVQSSSSIKFQSNKFIGSGATTGQGASLGLTILGSKSVQVTAASFSNLRLGLGVNTSTDVKVSSNKFTGMTSDGINIANSHRVTATSNTCTGTVPFLGAHPDCIQLWSVFGQPVQSDIALLRNTAIGATQGFASFNADDGGGLRISMIGNIVTTSYPQGIACYNCFDSIFTDNVLSTLPDAKWRTSMNIVGGGNNIIANNSIAAFVKPVTATSLNDGIEGIAASIGEDPVLMDRIEQLLLDDLALFRSGMLDPAAPSDDLGDFEMASSRFSLASVGVPDVAVWAQLIMGFGLVGALARRKARQMA